MVELPTHDLTADEFFMLETIVQTNAGAFKAGEDCGSTTFPNDLLYRLLAMARKPHDERRALRFLAVQTEAFAKCQAERDRLREAARVTIEGEHTSVTIRERLRAALKGTDA